MKKIFEQINTVITQALAFAVPFLCLAIVTQIIVGESLGGWDPVGNLKGLGVEIIVGLGAILILHSYITKK
jgi:hypothetical protein